MPSCPCCGNKLIEVNGVVPPQNHVGKAFECMRPNKKCRYSNFKRKRITNMHFFIVGMGIPVVVSGEKVDGRPSRLSKVS